MIRKPNPQAQAKLLVDALKEAGIQLKLGTALDIVARQHGHKSWNVMAATLKTGTTSSQGEVVRTAPSRGNHTPADKSLNGWCVGDVTEVRPDLYPGEAYSVLQEVVHRMDASIGINWDVISNQAHWMFPEHRCAVVHAVGAGVNCMVEVDLANGEIFDAPDEQEGSYRLVLRQRDERSRMNQLELIGDVELRYGAGTFTVDDVQEESGCRQDLFAALADPRLMQLADESSQLPFGVEVTITGGAASVNAGGLFAQLEAPKLTDLSDSTTPSTAAASGAAEALTSLLLALAARGVDVGSSDFAGALEETVESLANELG